MKPKIEFKVDKAFEKEVALYFWKKDNFTQFVEKYPSLLRAKEMREEDAKQFLSKEIDVLYEKNEDKLIALIPEIQEKWEKINTRFFVKVEKLFSHSWPKGSYYAYVSLFSMFRFKPGTKQFSIPSYDYAGNPPAFGHINFVICHELLHIFMEDYYTTHFKGRLPLHKYYDFLELMNCIVLNLSEITKITGWVNYPYEPHRELYRELKGVYAKSKDMKEFCEKMVKRLEK